MPNSIRDKPGPLSDSEMERVRLHAYYTDRVLHRAGKLAELASVASAAHERIGAGGYPRRIGGNTIPLLGRYLEAADTYHAMLRPASPRDPLAQGRRGGYAALPMPANWTAPRLTPFSQPLATPREANPPLPPD